jgi:hypothetical protein
MCIRVGGTFLPNAHQLIMSSIQNLKDAGLVNGSVGRIIDFKIPLDVRDSRKLSLNQPFNQMPNHPQLASCMEPNPHEEPLNLPSSFVYEGTRWPVVQYTNGRQVMMGPMDFTWERDDGKVQATRYQVRIKSD